MGASYQLTNAWEKKLLDESLGVGSKLLPSGVYVALFGATPADAGVFASELSTSIASGYTRVGGQGIFNAATSTDGFTENATDILFPTAMANWPTLAGMAIVDVGTQGQGSMIWWGGLNTVQTVLVNQRAKFAAGDLDVNID